MTGVGDTPIPDAPIAANTCANERPSVGGSSSFRTAAGSGTTCHTPGEEGEAAAIAAGLGAGSGTIFGARLKPRTNPRRTPNAPTSGTSGGSGSARPRIAGFTRVVGGTSWSSGRWSI